jgi:hypothetical protein
VSFLFWYINKVETILTILLNIEDSTRYHPPNSQYVTQRVLQGPTVPQGWEMLCNL